MNLDELFKLKGIRKNYAAKQLEIDPTTISNWSKGRTYPDLNQAVKLAEILNCKVDDLYIKEVNNNERSIPTNERPG